ncbi:RIP metalloprotease RseP [Helicobacter cynogastricus]|uniref:RIP metalloprotease RseP n=1 Tax=Helicobacter cynogastricus TaxID=329937 RepID=UPI000CF1B225|nr:RIP metalloprotease RseP [Helicobacter cynogastricus]
MGWFASVLALGFLIFFHELGHFLAARVCGVGVEVFSIGFGRKLWTKRLGNTQYALSVIPLGGYVKLQESPAESPRSYPNQPLFKKLIILSMGSFFNLLLAFGIYLGVGLVGHASLAPVVGALTPDMPAIKSGIKIGDRIVAVNGTTIKDWEALYKAIQRAQGTITLQIRRDHLLNITLTPIIKTTQNVFKESVQTKLIGITPTQEQVWVRYGFLESMQRALGQLVNMCALIIKGIEKLFTGVVHISEISSVVGIVDFMAHQQSFALLLSVAFISINLGILNLLPIPVLDGGQIAIVLYESLTKHKLKSEHLEKLNLLGIALLIALMILGLFNDVRRLIG